MSVFKTNFTTKKATDYFSEFFFFSVYIFFRINPGDHSEKYVQMKF